MLPKPPQELQRAERLNAIKVGDRDEYALRHREATGAVERLNNRIAGWISWAACQRALMAGEKREGC